MLPTIKFRMSHTTTTRDDEPLEERCDCDYMTYITFLHTSCSIIDGRKDTDFFKKKQTETSLYCLAHATQLRLRMPSLLR